MRSLSNSNVHDPNSVGRNVLPLLPRISPWIAAAILVCAVCGTAHADETGESTDTDELTEPAATEVPASEDDVFSSICDIVSDRLAEALRTDGSD